MWAASKISDTVGNYMQVFYTTDQGQYYPDHIVYTGNATAGVSPYNSVFFTYTPRNDASTLYHAGSLISTAKLLSDIKTYTNPTGTGTAVSDYKLAYTLGNSPFSQITSVQRCDGATPANCLAPATFGWQTASTWPSRIEVDSMPPIPGANPSATWLGVDFNGDGLLDGAGGIGCANIMDQPLLLNTPSSGLVPSGMTETYMGNPPSLACLQAAQPFGIIPAAATPDLNGDGLADLTVTQLLPFCSCNLQNDGQGHFLQVGSSTTGAFGSQDDFDGDGRNDRLWEDYNAQTYQLFYSLGDGYFRTGPVLPTGGTTSNPITVGSVRDFDGDGCTDLEFLGTIAQILSSCNPSVPLMTIPTSAGIGTALSGDFNGDGNWDYVQIPFSGASATLSISTGRGVIQSTVAGLQDGTPQHEFYTGDFDGDGKTDVAMVIPHYLKIFTWQSGNLVLALTVNIDLPQYGCQGTACTPPEFNGSLQTADVDGDGCTDLVVHQGGSNPFWYMKFGCHPPLLMISVSNGLGRRRRSPTTG